uniref:hypothetical protein n=1 Tax=Eubacterium cellulosolvens TaxID=29322 RepID=UPI0004897C95|nr:hypothetical protein [[Eubacterium] cellulosolvens]
MIQIVPDQKFDTVIKGKKKQGKVSFTFSSGSGMKLFVAYELIQTGLFGSKLYIGVLNPDTGDLETLTEEREIDQVNSALKEIWRERGRKNPPRLRNNVLTSHREIIAHFD